jgi:hypothetical protein
MIGQIGRLGKAPPRTGIIAALFYIGGVTLGAGLVGVAVGSLGYGVRWILYWNTNSHTSVVLSVVALAALLGGLRDLEILHFRLPQPERQVPENWKDVFGPYKTAFLWGLGIGLAYSTRIQFSLYYVLVLWVALLGQPLLGGAVLATYGLTQGGFLFLDTLALAYNRWTGGGLLGWYRSEFFYRMSGVFLVTCAVVLAVKVGLIPLAP